MKEEALTPRSKEFLKRLINSISPSGYEGEAADLWQAEAETFADEVYRDAHGNTVAVVNPAGKVRVMFAGHCDEIGFLITHIDNDGFLWISPIGGWDSQIAQGQRVWVRGKRGRVPGVIGKKPIHLLKDEARKRVVQVEELWVDLGVKNKKAAEQLVSIGDPLVLAHEYQELQGDMVVGRGMDDRAGAFVVLEAARLLAQLKPEAAIHAVATVQEEIGLRGATTSAYAINPQVGIAVDVTFATDHPSIDDSVKQEGMVKIGSGPVVTRGPNVNAKVFDLLIDTAKKEKIPVQLVAEPKGTGTDANAMQLSRAGVAAGLVSIPNRYMHSPCELVNLKDLEGCARLLAKTAARITPKTRLVPF